MEPGVPPPSSEKKKPRFICLHGACTSGEILSFQMVMMSKFIEIDSTFVNGLPARSEPEPIVKEVFVDMSYFEWYYKDKDKNISLNQSIDKIMQLIITKRFDGLLGFSQGKTPLFSMCLCAF